MSNNQNDLDELELEHWVNHRRTKRPTMKVSGKSVFRLQRLMTKRTRKKTKNNAR